MIDLTRKYKTRSGREVILHERKPLNSAGNPVTFPIKGSVVMSEKPRRTVLQIWTDEGRSSVLREHPHDLIEVAN